MTTLTVECKSVSSVKRNKSQIDERFLFINSGGRKCTGMRDGRINIEQFADHLKSCTSNDPY